MMNQPFNNNMNFNNNFNMNNMNMNQAMMNMNNLTNYNFNMNNMNQFFNTINSNPMLLMIWNQMLNQNMMQNAGNMVNMQPPQNMNNLANMQNFQNMTNYQRPNNYQININFMDVNWKKTIIITNPDEYMSSVINKYINKSGDSNMNNMYLFNGKKVVQSLTVAELGVMDGSEIYVVDSRTIKGAF